MEIRLTVHVPRRRPQPVDVVVSAHGGASAAELRAALSEHLQAPVPALVVGSTPVEDLCRVGAPPLLDGASVAVVMALDPGATPTGRPGPVLEVAAVGGPDAGRAHPLTPPGLDVGRSPHAGLHLADPSLSRVHARFDVGQDGVLVHDCDSTNGVLVDGRAISEPTRVDTASVVVIGASTLRLRRVSGPGMPLTHPGDGTVLVPPARRSLPELPQARVIAPRPPQEPPRGRIPWLAALLPVPVVVAMSFVLGPHLLAFALIGPLVLLATALGERVGRRRRTRAETAEHGRQLARARERFDAVLAEEERLRHLRHPDPHEVLRRAESHLPGLWSAAPGLHVRLGLGDLPSTARWVEDSHESPGTTRSVPVVVDLAEVGCLGVVAPADVADGLAGFVIGQLLVRLPPSALAVRRAPVPDETARAWRSMDLLPHHRPGAPAVLLLGDPGAEGAAALLSSTLEAGGTAIALAERAEDLPDACRAVLHALGGGRFRLDAQGGGTVLIGDAVSPPWSERLARALAPLRETDGPEALPSRLALAEVDDAAPLSVEGVRCRWARSRGPRAVVGSDADGAFVIDLAAQGPHVLVGGTTGSGKSEFLRTLVTGLALHSPPEDLTLLLVDFKGGAAFGPCASLPHVVGIVTDLDDHLVSRVLESLEAELHRRERLLAAVGASDLEDYRARGEGTVGLPRLVVVVDELRALVDEVPALVQGLVRLAAQGRSLGIHLVLATQRPTGTLSAEVQANVNLRIAFRVRDRSDSVGVVESDDAAQLPAETPGRAVARGGDGRLRRFQVALVSPALAEGPRVRVRPAAREVNGAPPAADGVCGDRAKQIAAVVDLVGRAHQAQRGTPPRRPWLPPLPTDLDATDCEAEDAVGLLDEPDHQRQSPLRWSTSSPTPWRLVGRPRSGRSTALRALVHAAARSHSPQELHVHAIGAEADLGPLRALPHVGTLARTEDPAAVRALLAHLGSSSTDAGTAATPATPATTLVVLDGWEHLTELDDPREPVPLSDILLRVLRDGAGSGLRVAVTGGRDLLRSRWSALGGEVFLLGSPDPVDAALLGIPAGALPRAAPPGRAVRAGDTREVQFVRPRDGAEDAIASRWAPLPGPGPGARPWRHRPLPAVVHREEIEAPGSTPGLLLGVGGPQSTPWSWDPARHGRRFLVTGPPGSGRSTALRALATSAVTADRAVLWVAAQPGAVPAGEPWEVLGPDDLGALVEHRRARPDVLVLVDDADRLDGAPLAPALREVAQLVDRDDGAIVLATTTAALRTRFRGLDVEMAQHRCGLVLHPERGDAEVLGSRIPSAPRTQRPGSGVLVVCGTVLDLQVLAGD